MPYLGCDPRGHRPPKPPPLPPPLARIRRFSEYDAYDAYELVRFWRSARKAGDFPTAAAVLDELRELARRPRVRERGRDDRGDP